MAIFLRAQAFDESRHLVETGAELGLSLVYLFCRRTLLDGVLVCRHGDAKYLQDAACFVAWHDFIPAAAAMRTSSSRSFPPVTKPFSSNPLAW